MRTLNTRLKRWSWWEAHISGCFMLPFIQINKWRYDPCTNWTITLPSYYIPFTGKHEPNKLTYSQLCDFVAQLVRALHRHRRGHGFESRWVTWVFQAHETIVQQVRGSYLHLITNTALHITLPSYSNKVKHKQKREVTHTYPLIEAKIFMKALKWNKEKIDIINCCSS